MSRLGRIKALPRLLLTVVHGRYLGPDLGPGTAGQYTMCVSSNHARTCHTLKMCEMLCRGWTLLYIPLAIPLGVLSGILATIMLLLRGVIGKAVASAHARLGLSPRSPASLILLPALGGLGIGLIAILAPLTIGNGSVPLSSVMADGYAALWTREQARFYAACELFIVVRHRWRVAPSHPAALLRAACGPVDCIGNATAAITARELAGLRAGASIQKMQYTDALVGGWPNPPPEVRTYSASLLVGTLFLKMLGWAVSQVCGGRQLVCGAIPTIFL